MAKPTHIPLQGSDPIPILYEDRSVLAIDKPIGWMLVPFTWQRTSRNLQAALTSSIAAGHFWARSRGLTALQHVHRLDAETSGVLLFCKSSGGLRTYAGAHLLLDDAVPAIAGLAFAQPPLGQGAAVLADEIGADLGHVRPRALMRW